VSMKVDVGTATRARHCRPITGSRYHAAVITRSRTSSQLRAVQPAKSESHRGRVPRVSREGGRQQPV